MTKPLTDFSDFWDMYPSDLCRGSKNKGGRGKAEESWSKHVKEPEKVILALQAQIKYDRDAQNKGEDVDRWPFASTWLNQGRWDVEIESHAELQQRYEGKYCSVEGCPDLTHGPRFEYCAHHLNFTIDGKFKDVMMAEELREFYTTHKDLPFMEDKSEVMKWVRARIVEIGKPGP